MVKLRLSWISCCVVVWLILNQAYAREEILLSYSGGVRITLETTYFRHRENLVSSTVIMKRGKKIRIEETIPLSSGGISKTPTELKRIIISDGKATWFILDNGKKEKSDNPIRNPLGFIPCSCKKGKLAILDGREVRVIETAKNRKDKWYIDLTAEMPLKREKDNRVTFYKEYAYIEGVGYLPKSTETYERGNLIMRTTVKGIEKYRMFADELFDPNKVTLTKTGEKTVEEYLPH